MKKRVIIVLLSTMLALALTLFLSACGDDESDVDAAIDKAVEQAEEQLGGGGEQIDACGLLTQEDASSLFGAEAVAGTPDTPFALGECVWERNIEVDGMLTSSQELMLLVQDEIYHYSDPALESVDVGDGGTIEVNVAAELISVTWLQDNRSYMLTYFSIGEDMPDVATLADAMKDLAKKVSDQA